MLNLSFTRRLSSGSAVVDCQRLAVVVTVAAGLIAVGACETGECQNFNDCPSGERCNADNVCETIPNSPSVPSPATANPGVAQPDPPDGGPQPEGAVEIEVQTAFAVPFIQPGVLAPTSSFLVAHYEAVDEAVSVDEMRLFDTSTGNLAITPAFDFIDAVDGPCGIEQVVNEPQLNNGETWVACRDELRIYYDLDQPAHLPGMLVHHGIAITPVSSSDFGRRVWFERGGTTLTSFIVRPSQDGQYIDRLRDTIETVTFSGIVDVFQLPNNANAVPGESILVVDRSETGIRVVPLQHDTGSNLWRPHNNLSPVDLGEKGHTVVVVGDVNPQGQANAANIPNIMVIEPENGVARYFKVENGEEVLPRTVFEPGQGFRAEAPLPSVRQIHAVGPSGQAVFYGLPGVAKVWRIPFAPGSDNLVTFHILNNGNLEPTGVFPVEEQLAWVTTSQDRLLFRTRFVGTQ